MITRADMPSIRDVMACIQVGGREPIASPQTPFALVDGTLKFLCAFQSLWAAPSRQPSSAGAPSFGASPVLQLDDFILASVSEVRPRSEAWRRFSGSWVSLRMAASIGTRPIGGELLSRANFGASRLGGIDASALQLEARNAARRQLKDLRAQNALRPMPRDPRPPSGSCRQGPKAVGHKHFPTSPKAVGGSLERLRQSFIAMKVHSWWVVVISFQGLQTAVAAARGGPDVSLGQHSAMAGNGLS